MPLLITGLEVEIFINPLKVDKLKFKSSDTDGNQKYQILHTAGSYKNCI